MNPSTSGVSETSVPLVTHLQAILAAHRPAFRQERPYARAMALVLAQLFAFGRHTITQLLLSMGLAGADPSAWYRLFSVPRYDEEVLANCLLGEVLAEVPAEAPLVVGVDGVQIPRSSLTMPGTSWLHAPRTPVWKRGIHRAQRYLHLAWLLPRVAGFSRALPLRWLSAFPEKACQALEAPRSEWAAAVAGLDWLRAQLDVRGRGAQPVLVVADGSFDTLDWWRALPAGVHALVRTAKNRVLRAYLPPEARDGRRKYGPRLPAPKDYLPRRTGWRRACVRVRGHMRRMRYQVVGPVVRQGAPDLPLFLLVVAGQYRQVRGTRKRRQPVFYLVSAVPSEHGWQLPLAAEELLAWAWQRWELEVAHREMKTTWGIGQSQCWNARATVGAVQFAVWSYAVLLLAGYRAWGLLHGAALPTRWWRGARRWSFMTLWRAYRYELWQPPQMRALWTPIGDNWPLKAAALDALTNSIRATSKG